MKQKLTLLSVVGLFAAGLIASAQTSTPAGDNSQPAAAPAVVAATTPAEATASPSPAPATTAAPAPQDNPGSATNATAATTNTPATTDTNTTAAMVTNNPVATDTATAPAPASAPRDPNAVIPLIVMDEVPLTDAIKNLARQSGLNYMLDPKIPYGNVGPDGRLIPQPNVTIRWENRTAEQALSAVLATYGLTIVDDPKTMISRITVKDPAAPEPLQTKIVQLKYSDASNMVASVQTVLQDKRSKVMPDVRTSQLIIVATEKELVAVDELVARLDTQTKEVLIEARLIETSKNPTTAKGIDWSGTLQAQHINFGNNVLGGQSGNPYPVTQTFTQTPLLGFGPGGITTNGLVNQSVTTYGPNSPVATPGLLVDTSHGLNPSTAFLNADGVSAVLSFLNTDADAKVLSTPRAVTLDNTEAVLSVTTAEPIFLTTAGTQGSPGGSQVVYTNLGTILKVTPRISANNTINLKVVPEVSDLGGTITKTVAGLVNQADFFDIRKITTTVLIPSGNTLVMGGLVNDNQNKGSTKVPILGDIPLLGWAFRQETKSQNKRNLIVFITPTIVQDEDFQPTQTDFLKTRLNDKPTADFGPWDSGEPQDWSKLFHKQSSTSTDTSDSAPKYPDAPPSSK